MRERREDLWQAVRHPFSTIQKLWQAAKSSGMDRPQAGRPPDRPSPPASTPEDPWLQLFKRPLPVCVRVRLRNKREIFGLYGEDSIAFPGSRDLYLQHHVIIHNGQLDKFYPKAQGVWLSGSEIITLEFLERDLSNTA